MRKKRSDRWVHTLTLSTAYLTFLLLLAAGSLWAAGPFVTEPYLQLGDARGLQKSETLALLWHTAADSTGWAVEVKSGPMWKTGPLWKKMAAPSNQRVAVVGIDPHLVWRATLTGLA